MNRESQIYKSRAEARAFRQGLSFFGLIRSKIVRIPVRSYRTCEPLYKVVVEVPLEYIVLEESEKRWV